ncbi:MAG: ArsR family transcriptional regulator [Anaerolineae bacterium]|nr:ArsR family transcriptional regulator [Anaerolineae bacterium]
MQILKRNGPSTVSDLANALELSRSATRHHLRVLERNGLVAALGTATPTGVGRPGLLYGLTSQALSVFPQGYDRLVNGLLREIKTLLMPAQVIRLCERIGKELAAEAPQRRPGQSVAEHFQEVADFLTSRGYLAQFTQEGDQWTLELGNCPYACVVQVHAEVCMLDQVMLSEILSDEVKPIQLWVNGAPTCSFSFTPPSEPKLAN